MDRPRTAPRLLVSLFASVVFAAACSSGGGQEAGLKGATTGPSATDTPDTTVADAADSDPHAVLVDAIDKTRSAKTMDITLELAFDGGKVLGKQQVTIGGELATDGTRASLSSSADGVGAMQVRILDDKAWVGGDMEQVRQALPKGAEWAEVATKDLVASPGFGDVGDLSFIYLLGGATNVEATGDGEYAFDLDVAKAASSAPADLREEVSGALSFSGENEPEITGTVELDDEGRVASMAIHGVQTPSPAEAEQFGDDAVIKLSLEVEIDDFGEPVEVEPPAADSVVPIVEAPELAKLLGLVAEPGIEG